MAGYGRRRLARLAAGLAAAALAAAPAAGQLDSAFSAWDTDDDGTLSRAEFRAGMGAWGVYERWDTDRDGLLSDEEYRPAPPAHFDAAQAEAWNDSGAGLDREGMADRFYDAYDVDDDRTLAESEFAPFAAEAAERGWVE